MLSIDVPPRTSPISETERDLIVSLVKAEKVLQNRKTDGRMLSLKRQAWARVAQCFNTHNLGPKRTEQQLKKVWDRFKFKESQEYPLERNEMMKTISGHLPPGMPDYTDKLLDIPPHHILVSDEREDLGCPYDNDAMSSKANSYSLSTPEVAVQDDQLMQQDKDGIRSGAMGHPSSSNQSMLPEEELSGQLHQRIPGSAPNKKFKRASKKMAFDLDGFGEIYRMEQLQLQIMERRKELLDLQIKDTKIRVEEAEILKEIAKYKLAKEKCNFKSVN